jgi:opacity protein-like surface antigen
MKRFVTLALLVSPVMAAAQTTDAVPGYGASGYGTTSGYGSADGYASQASPYLTRSQITSGNINKMRYATPTVNPSLMSPQAAKEQYSETHNPDGSPK